MDHFSGFDRVVRILLARDKRLHLFGPPGFIDRVEHRLASYTWNLVENYPVDFTIIAREFDGEELRSARFRCRNRFFREPEAVSPAADGVLLDDETFRIRAGVLDHRIPCLAFTLRRRTSEHHEEPPPEQDAGRAVADRAEDGVLRGDLTRGRSGSGGGKAVLFKNVSWNWVSPEGDPADCAGAKSPM
jgi:ribonuclease BN (tRNA processing enzyme)